MQIRGSIVVSISACHADDPGSIPGRGVFRLHIRIKPQRQKSGAQKNIGGFGSGLLHLTHCSNRTSSPTPQSSIYMSYAVACFKNDVLEPCEAQVSQSNFAFNHVDLIIINTGWVNIDSSLDAIRYIGDAIKYILDAIKYTPKHISTRLSISTSRRY